jgi:formamidopyrimidine-DNA glycosylase
MIELPEAMALAGQINDELKGAVIESGNCGNRPHKWAFYSRLKAQYPQILAGKKVGKADGAGSMVAVRLKPGYALMLGDGGLRILLHGADDELPKKHQLLLRFKDGRRLTVSVQGWGFLQLIPEENVATHHSRQGISPVSDAFTYERFKGLVLGYERAEKDSLKKYLISESGISGIGNGYLQDILFRAKLHPRRKVAEMTGKERLGLYRAIRTTMREAARLGGRDTERGLHGEGGGYHPILDTRAKGRPCPECGTAIEKISYLGGSCYLCSSCQK